MSLRGRGKSTCNHQEAKLTTEQELARFLALAVKSLGGSLKVSKELLDNMLPTRLVWDTTSDPDHVIVATISNDVIMLTVERPEVAQDES